MYGDGLAIARIVVANMLGRIGVHGPLCTGPISE